MEWTSARRLQLVLRILRNETSVAEAAKHYGLPPARIEDWRSRALHGAELQLCPRRQLNRPDLENYVEYL